jgi:hypothetical protein
MVKNFACLMVLQGVFEKTGRRGMFFVVKTWRKVELSWSFAWYFAERASTPQISDLFGGSRVDL